MNRKDDEQLTALHWAAISNNAPHAKLLLDFQADPAIGDKDQRTPLHYAISRGSLDFAKVRKRVITFDIQGTLALPSRHYQRA